jgi:tetratricopeptide (TPR) repeat protein
VEAILDLSAYENAPWLIDALQSLVEKSLVRYVTDARFDLLVSVQEYAAEHLRTAARYAGSGPAALLAAETRHGAYFAGLDEKAAVADRCAELENLVVACRRAAARGDVDMAVRSLEGAWAGVGLRGPFQVGVELASLVRPIAGIGTAAVARVDYVAGRALEASGKNPEAHERYRTSLAQAREIGDRRSESRTLLSLGSLERHAGRSESARACVEMALSIARELNDRSIQSDAYNVLGNVESVLGQREQALAHYDAALALAREAGNRHREGSVLGNLGNEYAEMGIMDKARLHHEAALAVAREVGNRRLEGNTLCNLGLLHQVQGRFGEALDQLEAALAVARDMGNAHVECVVLCNLGMAYDSLVRFDEARDHFEAALAIARAMGDRRREGQFLSYLGLLHAHRAKFDDARHCLEASEALLRAVSDRMSLGILLCGRAETEHLAGVPDAARTALGAADIIATEVGAGSDSELGRALARVRNLLPDEQRSGLDSAIAG